MNAKLKMKYGTATKAWLILSTLVIRSLFCLWLGAEASITLAVGDWKIGLLKLVLAVAICPAWDDMK